MFQIYQIYLNFSVEMNFLDKGGGVQSKEGSTESLEPPLNPLLLQASSFFAHFGTSLILSLFC